MSALAGAAAGPVRASGGVVFGSLFDLARLRAGSGSAEVCEACNTINMGSARWCKGCSHKLPAFYADERPGARMSSADTPSTTPERGWALDFAAFWLVIGSLVVATALIRVG